MDKFQRGELAGAEEARVVACTETESESREEVGEDEVDGEM